MTMSTEDENGHEHADHERIQPGSSTSLPSPRSAQHEQLHALVAAAAAVQDEALEPRPPLSARLAETVLARLRAVAPLPSDTSAEVSTLRAKLLQRTAAAEAAAAGADALSPPASSGDAHAAEATPPALTAYDLGVLAIPDEEYDVAERIFGKLVLGKGKSKSKSKSKARRKKRREQSGSISRSGSHGTGADDARGAQQRAKERPQLVGGLPLSGLSAEAHSIAARVQQLVATLAQPDTDAAAGGDEAVKLRIDAARELGLIPEFEPSSPLPLFEPSDDLSRFELSLPGTKVGSLVALRDSLRRSNDWTASSSVKAKAATEQKQRAAEQVQPPAAVAGRAPAAAAEPAKASVGVPPARATASLMLPPRPAAPAATDELGHWLLARSDRTRGVLARAAQLAQEQDAASAKAASVVQCYSIPLPGSRAPEAKDAPAATPAPARPAAQPVPDPEPGLQPVSCLVSIKLLQNLRLRKLLEHTYRIVLIERPADDGELQAGDGDDDGAAREDPDAGVDLFLDCTTALVFVKSAVLPSLVHSLPGRAEAARPAAAQALWDVLALGRFAAVHVVIEQYTSGGMALPLTPPVEKAVAALRRALNESITPYHLQPRGLALDLHVHHATSPADAAAYVRARIDEIQQRCSPEAWAEREQVLQLLAGGGGTPEERERTALELNALAPLLNVLAAQTLLVRSDSLPAFLDMPAQKRQALCEEFLGAAHAQALNDEVDRQRAEAEALQAQAAES